MSPCNNEALPVFARVPLNRPGAPSPLHAVRCYSIHGPESHLVKLALEAHVSHAKSVLLVSLSTLDTEVEPRLVVAD